MSVDRLPLSSEHAHQSLSVELGGSPFTIEILWSDRDAAWYLSVYAEDADATPIVEGWRVCVSGLPLRRTRGSARPPGEILFVDLGGTLQDPGRDELGERVIALYYDPDDFAELNSGA